MMLNLIFILALLVYLLCCFWYYKKQNNTSSIGGPIAPAKIFWLGFASFQYFVLTLILLFGIPESNTWFFLLKGMVGLLFTRAILQSLLMFVVHKWSPPMGIAYNVFCMLFLIAAYFFKLPELFTNTALEKLLANFVMLLFFILLVDSVYAYKFYRVVGAKTKGKEAIWYASEKDPDFAKIIQLTQILNVPFAIYFIYITYQILFNL